MLFVEPIDVVIRLSQWWFGTQYVKNVLVYVSLRPLVLVTDPKEEGTEVGLVSYKVVYKGWIDR
jgi:hypothetical protein